MSLPTALGILETNLSTRSKTTKTKISECEIVYEQSERKTRRVPWANNPELNYDRLQSYWPQYVTSYFYETEEVYGR